MAPRKKATPAVDTDVKTEAAAVEVAAENTAAEAEKKAPAKKATKAAAKTTKAAAKKTTTTRTKKAAAKTETVEEAPVVAPVEAPKAEVFIEYGGAQVSVEEIIGNAKKIVGDDKDIKIYVQPDTSKAYIAFNGESVSMDVFFCK